MQRYSCAASVCVPCQVALCHAVLLLAVHSGLLLASSTAPATCLAVSFAAGLAHCCTIHVALVWMLQGNLRMGLNAVSMSSIFGGRRRSESGNLPSPGGPAAGAPSPAGTGVVDAAVAAALGGEQSLVTVLAMVSDKDKDMALDSEGEPESPLSRLEEDVDVECGVCLDALVGVCSALAVGVWGVCCACTGQLVCV